MKHSINNTLILIKNLHLYIFILNLLVLIHPNTINLDLIEISSDKHTNINNDDLETWEYILIISWYCNFYHKS